MKFDWSYGAVAFIDVLGYSAFVESDSRSLTPTHLQKLRDLLAQIRDAAPDLDVRAFSDSITIAAPLESTRVAQLLLTVIQLQKHFVDGGFLVRGGVAFGKHYSDDALVFSEALIRAYQLERDLARFPRILLDSDLLDWFFNAPATTEEQTQLVRKLLLTDRDNLVFLDYLSTEALERHLNLINSYSARSSTPSVLEKIQWLCHYHNFVAGRSNSTHVYSGPITHGFRALEVRP